MEMLIVMWPFSLHFLLCHRKLVRVKDPASLVVVLLG